MQDRGSKSRLRRVLIGVAVAILSLYALYVGASNVFLSTSLFERATRGNPEALFVAYERAWSLWPGTVHVRRLAIRGSDSNVQWLLRLERCTFDVSLRDLATRRTFHADHVRGAGVTFDLRRRLDAPSATPEHVDALPPIPGFPRIPLKRQELPDLRVRWDDRFYRLWTVELTDVIADDVREVWIDTARIEGSSRVTGGFFLKPIRRAQVGPVHVELQDARITASERPVAVAVTGSIDLELDAFDPRVVRGAAIVERLSLGTDLRGHVPDVANLRPPRGGSSIESRPLEVSGPAEVRALALRLAHGEMQPGTHVDVVLPGLRAEAAGALVTGDVTLGGDVPDGPAPPTLELRATKIEVRPSPRGRPALSIRQVSLAARTGRIAVADPLAHLELDGVVEGGRALDAGALRALLPRSGDLTVDAAAGEGPFGAEVHARVDDRVARGSISARAYGVGVRSPKVRVRGDVAVHADVAAWSLDDGRMNGVIGDARIDDLAAHFGPAPPREREAAGAADLSARRVELRAKVPALHLSRASLRDADYRLVVVDAALPDATRLAALLSPRGAGELAIESGAARGSADLSVSPSRGTAGGSVRLAFRNAGIRLHETRLRGAFDVDLRIAGLEPSGRQVVDIAGSRIALREIAVVGGAARASAWSGELAVRRGALRLGDTPGVDALVQLRADDATPILALTVGNKVPGFVVGSLRAAGLTAEARVVVEHDRAAILDARARGDDVALAGDYVTRSEHARAAFTVEKGALSAGVKVDDSGTSVRLFGLDSWRAEERRSVLTLFVAPPFP